MQRRLAAALMSQDDIREIFRVDFQKARSCGHRCPQIGRANQVEGEINFVNDVENDAARLRIGRVVCPIVLLRPPIRQPGPTKEMGPNRFPNQALVQLLARPPHHRAISQIVRDDDRNSFVFSLFDNLAGKLKVMPKRLFHQRRSTDTDRVFQVLQMTSARTSDDEGVGFVQHGFARAGVAIELLREPLARRRRGIEYNNLFSERAKIARVAPPD